MSLCVCVCMGVCMSARMCVRLCGAEGLTNGKTNTFSSFGREHKGGQGFDSGVHVCVLLCRNFPESDLMLCGKRPTFFERNRLWVYVCVGACVYVCVGV